MINWINGFYRVIFLSILLTCIACGGNGDGKNDQDASTPDVSDGLTKDGNDAQTGDVVGDQGDEDGIIPSDLADGAEDVAGQDGIVDGMPDGADAVAFDEAADLWPDADGAGQEDGDISIDLPPPPTCEGDDMCTGLQTCGDAGFCEQPSVCLKDEDCLPGYTCSLGKCRVFPKGCLGPEDCVSAGGECDLLSGTCRDKESCTEESDCLNEHICWFGRCVECVTNVHCPSSALLCMNNYCVESGFCAINADCLNGRKCILGTCQYPEVAPDAFEENDDIHDAATNEPLDAGEYPNLTITPTDDDWYRINVPDGWGMIAQVSFDGAGGDLDLYLHDQDGQYLVDFDGLKRDFAVVTVGKSNASENPYYLEVVLAEGFVESYTLTLIFVPKTFCENDIQEANDSKASATPLAKLKEDAYGLQLCSGDVDWFSLQAETDDTTIAVQVELPLGGSTTPIVELNIYDAVSSAPIATSEGSQTFFGQVVAQPKGNYYLEVKAKDGTSEVPYALRYLLQWECTDPYEENNGSLACMEENNDTAVCAHNLTTGLHDDAFLCKTEDADWYQFEVAASKGINIDLTYDNTLTLMNMELYQGPDNVWQNAQLVEVSFNVDSPEGTVTQNIHIPRTDEAAHYFLGIVRAPNAISFSNVPYSVKLDVVNAFCVEDNNEDDDTPADANILAPLLSGYNSGIYCAGDPADWWMLTVDEADGQIPAINALMTYDLANANLSFELYGASDFSTPLTSGTAFSLGKYIIFTPSAAGTYYIKVTGTGDTTYNIYAENTVVMTCAVSEDTWEENDFPPMAKKLTLPAVPQPTPDKVQNLVACETDADWYYFDAKKDSEAAITVIVTNPTTEDVTVSFWVYQPDLRQLIKFNEWTTKAGTDNLHKAIINLPASWFPDDGPYYYLRVDKYLGGNATYDIYYQFIWE